MAETADRRARGNRPPPTVADWVARRWVDQADVLVQDALAGLDTPAHELDGELLRKMRMQCLADVVRARAARDLPPATIAQARGLAAQGRGGMLVKLIAAAR